MWSVLIIDWHWSVRAVVFSSISSQVKQHQAVYLFPLLLVVVETACVNPPSIEMNHPPWSVHDVPTWPIQSTSVEPVPHSLLQHTSRSLSDEKDDQSDHTSPDAERLSASVDGTSRWLISVGCGGWICADICCSPAAMHLFSFTVECSGSDWNISDRFYQLRFSLNISQVRSVEKMFYFPHKCNK